MTTKPLSGLSPGEPLLVYANRASRRATVLAVRGHRVLIEYVMPGGTTALRIVRTDAPEHDPGWGQRIPYVDLSLPWLQAMVDARQGWLGHPQQHRHPARRVPTPGALLQHQGFRQALHRFWLKDPGPRLIASLRLCRGCDWVTSFTRGGCWLAARGMQVWVEEARGAPARPQVNARPLVVAEYGRKPRHVVLSLGLAGEEAAFVDAEGIWRRERLLARWEKVHGLNAPSLIDYRPAHLGDFAFDWDVCDALVAALKDRFGPFTPALVFPAAGPPDLWSETSHHRSQAPTPPAPRGIHEAPSRRAWKEE